MKYFVHLRKFLTLLRTSQLSHKLGSKSHLANVTPETPKVLANVQNVSLTVNIPVVLKQL